MGSATNVALPAIGREMGLHAVDLSWVATAYLLSAAVFLVPFGKLADIHGRKRVFVGGLVVYTVTSLLCALAPSYPVPRGRAGRPGPRRRDGLRHRDRTSHLDLPAREAGPRPRGERGRGVPRPLAGPAARRPADAAPRLAQRLRGQRRPWARSRQRSPRGAWWGSGASRRATASTSPGRCSTGPGSRRSCTAWAGCPPPPGGRSPGPASWPSPPSSPGSAGRSTRSSTWLSSRRTASSRSRTWRRSSTTRPPSRWASCSASTSSPSAASARRPPAACSPPSRW